VSKLEGKKKGNKKQANGGKRNGRCREVGIIGREKEGMNENEPRNDIKRVRREIKVN